MAKVGLPIFLLAFSCASFACQRYPFEAREPQRSEIAKTSAVVLTTRPTDILFVIDNSGTMEDERRMVAENIGLFLDALTASATDFQVGLITTDVECNLPSYNCDAGGSSPSCCLLRGTVTCRDEDTDGDSVLDATDCDGGRLRSATGRDRIFRRPSEAGRDAWVADFQAAITALDCDVIATPHKPQGSGFEGGLEAVVRSVGCSTGQDCLEPEVAELNAGFIRPDADLVVIFVTDEDDCSVADPEVFRRPAAGETYSEAYQASHLCSPEECYAGTPGLYDWWFNVSTNKPLCGEFGAVVRSVPPPALTPVSEYLDRLVALKGGDVRRIRAAAIVSGVLDEEAPLGFLAAACYASGAGPSIACGCLSTAADEFFCKLTELLGQGGTRAGTSVPSQCNAPALPLLGCTSLPGARYVSFLRELALRREAAGVAPDVLVDSICQARYDDTLYRVVNNVVINNCFEVSVVPERVDQISVRRNGAALPNVAVRSPQQGWSWRSGSNQICLEGGLQKSVSDRFDIYVLSPEP